MKKSIFIHVVVIYLLFTCVSYGGTNWPGWRGVDAMGVSTDSPPVKWSETENIKWKVKLTGDTSDSSVIVWEDKIFFQTAVKTDIKPETSESAEAKEDGQRSFGGKSPKNVYKFNVVCLNRKTGKVMWEKLVKEILPHEGHHADHGFASSTPVTDGKYVWANFGSRGVYCLDMKGKIKWSKELGIMNTRRSFGEGSSPVLAGKNLIVVMDHEGQSAIYALNKNSGDIAWKKDRDELTSWTTPLVLDVKGKTQIIVNGDKRTRSYDPDTGDVIWECGGQTQNVIPTPVAGFGMVFCTSGFRGNKLQAIKPDNKGDLTGTDAVVWEIDKATPYVPSPILYGQKLYVLSGNKGVVSCYNAKTGKPYYVTKKLDEMKGLYASPVAAAGRVYFTGWYGVTYVLKNSDSFEVAAINKLDDAVDCSMAIADNEIYLKGKKYLYCIAAKK